MKNSRNSVQMGFTNERFPAGTHMCLIYNTEAERRHIIARYLDSGLLTGENVMYFADVPKPQEVVDWLKNMGVAGAEDLKIFEAADTYCPNGSFVPETMYGKLKDAYNSSISEGYSGIRVSGEMDWALRGIPGSERLMEYESKVNELFEQYPVTAICQYNASRFDGQTILDAMRVHPMMIINGSIARNPFYLTPKDFLAEFNSRQKPS